MKNRFFFSCYFNANFEFCLFIKVVNDLPLLINLGATKVLKSKKKKMFLKKILIEKNPVDFDVMKKTR
jgi:hypothetical protein